jgi:hypothetical protein
MTAFGLEHGRSERQILVDDGPSAFCRTFYDTAS